MRRATRAAIAVAAALLLLKAIGWWSSRSAALFASLTDSSLDLLASGLNAWAIARAMAPADREHRHGHGKLEALAALAQAVLITAAALTAAWQGWLAIREPQGIGPSGMAIAVMVVALVATVWLVRLQRQAAGATGSLAIAADSLHYSGDIGQNAGVLIGIAASVWLDLAFVDGAVGLLVALWIGRGAIAIGRSAVDQLLDSEADDETRAEVLRCLREQPGVRGVHDLRSRRSGPQLHATAHLAVDGEMTVKAAHELATAAEERLQAQFPGGHFVLHVDPDDLDREDPFGDDPAGGEPGRSTQGAGARPA